MSLLDVNLKQEYRSPRDNIVNDFYIPLLKEANLYKRSVGFFSSSSLLEISYGITHLINNNGKIQLIASPHLSEEDIEAINKGYEAREDIVERALMQYITEPQNYFEEERLNLLANLIAQEKLDIKIAFSSKYMLDAIKSFNCDQVELMFNGEIKPIIIKNAEDDKLTQLILPIRTY